MESLEEVVAAAVIALEDAVIEAEATAAPPILMRETLGEDDSLRRQPPDSRLEPAGTVSTMDCGVTVWSTVRAAGWGAAAAIMAMMPMAGAGAMD